MPLSAAPLAALACALAGCGTMGLYRPGGASGPEVLEVVLEDASVDVSPNMVARGKVGLELVNHGTLEHAVRVVGPGVDEQSEESLSPGQSHVMWLKLGAGTYRIFCPDANHADLGMWAQLVVTDAGGWFRR